MTDDLTATKTGVLADALMGGKIPHCEVKL